MFENVFVAVEIMVVVVAVDVLIVVFDVAVLLIVVVAVELIAAAVVVVVDDDVFFVFAAELFAGAYSGFSKMLIVKRHKSACTCLFFNRIKIISRTSKKKDDHKNCEN